MGTADIVVGVLAALGVLVLIAVFVYVVKTVLLKKD
jgi:Flp pilus assembly pilin Flp